ncbi:MAG: PspA/IM30 family protein [Actinomycetes bacterium]
MANLFTRVWKYLTAALTGRFDELADPKVQLEQAIAEAQEQHRRLKEQAANVIANQKQTELKLERAMGELEKLNTNAQQALLMAEEARSAGDAARAAEYESAAESIATRLLAVEQEVEDLSSLGLEAAKASEQAKNAVAQNSAVLQQKLAEKQQLLSQLDQAKMAEQMNDAMATLSESVGADVPTFDEVRDKIERRMAKAQGRAELEGNTVESRMLEIEQASRNVEAQKRLSELRSKLGLASTAEQAAATAPAEEPAGETEGTPRPSPGG